MKLSKGESSEMRGITRTLRPFRTQGAGIKEEEINSYGEADGMGQPAMFPFL